MILPVSAEILANLPAYDACLEQFSKPLLAAAEYSLTEAREMTVETPSDIEGFYCYPDLAAQAAFLGQMLEKMIQQAIPDEIHFLQKFDRARRGIGAVVDLPDRKSESLLKRLFTTGGKLGQKRRQREFTDFTDQEVAEVKESYRPAFSDD